jgi:hypothetical protein
LLTGLGLLLYLRSLIAPGLVPSLTTATPVARLGTTFTRLTLAAAGLALTAASGPALGATPGSTLTSAAGLTLAATTAGLTITTASGLALTATAVAASSAVPTSRLAARKALPLGGFRGIHECC